MQNDALLAAWPAEETPEAPVQASDRECPRCQQVLIDPNGLGWCKACGYCRSLETEKGNQLLTGAPGPSRGGAMAGAAGNVPVWFWVLLAGVAGLAGLSLAAGRFLPAGNGLPRALWTSIQMAVGLLVMFAGQLCAVVLIAPEDERLSFKDALVPTRLWSLLFKRLPRHSWCLWTSTWGVSLIVFALLFVGGLQHWFSYLPTAKTPTVAPARVWK